MTSDRLRAPTTVTGITTALVLAWLGFQTLFPLRHYLIPGDARVTFEGLSFSWRLKAEVYQSEPCLMTIRDPALVSTGSNACPEIHWSIWKGDPALYRLPESGPVAWNRLPELVILSGPLTGERVVFNPFSGRTSALDEATARRRAGQLWEATFGRAPKSLRRTLPRPRLMESFATALRADAASGFKGDVLGHLARVRRRDGYTSLQLPLRWIQPFGFVRDDVPDAPFLLVEDDGVYETSPASGVRVRRDRWRSAPVTALAPLPESLSCLGLASRPVVVLEADPAEARTLLPRESLVLRGPGDEPVVVWNYLADIATSKAMHISTNPFLLRRYARHVADLWEARYGHRPRIQAETSVSMNFRPFQPVVDPAADLASVPTSFWSHDPWVLDLANPRIPR